jgi:AAA+ superfamily predicted ATPase
MDTKSAVAEVKRAIAARCVLIGIESGEESRVMDEIELMAAEPTLSVSGEVLVPSRALFQWTHTNGIVRNQPPYCGCGRQFSSVVHPDGDVFYHCECGREQPTEFSKPTTDPSYAIQDFISHATGDGTIAAFTERASILVLSDIHRWLMGSQEGGESATRTMRALRDLAAKLPVTKSVVILLAPSLNRLGDAERHCHMVRWPLPTVGELADMVKQVGEKMADRIPVSLNGSTEELAGALAALTHEEAARVLKLAIVDAKKLDGTLAPDLMAAKANILQAAQGIKLTTPRFSLDDVGGLDAVRESLGQLPRLLTRKAKELKVRAPRGILLGGPPGTGKSLLAEAIAAETNMPLLAWDLGGSKSKWYGESEHQVRGVLGAADAIGRCVLWIDEAEKQLGSGDNESHEVTESIMGAVLKWMQEREGDCIVVMTVNRPDRLRAELESRFDQKWFVDYPNAEGCAAIVGIHCQRRGLVLTQAEYNELGAIAAGHELCGREIEHAVEAALRDAFLADHQPGMADLRQVLNQSRGQASDPKRKQELEDMRAQCAGRFQPAGSPKRAAPVVERAAQNVIEM